MARDYRLSENAVALALDLTGARPDAPAWRAFALRVLNGAGLAAVAAGAIFFVAANWHAYGVIGRFAILEAAFVACVGLAWWRPPPAALAQAALVLATLLTGALLALFGQTYQTGADVYELSSLGRFYRCRFAEPRDAPARYGEFRLDKETGEAVLVGLRDAKLNAL